MRFLSLILASLLLSAPVMAQTVSTPTPTTVGTALVGQIPGTGTNDTASVGNVGEIVKSTIASGSAVPLTTTTTVNLTSIPLTAGDWDVYVGAIFQGSATTVVSSGECGINTTTATMPTFSIGDTNYATVSPQTGVLSTTVGLYSCPVGPFRISLSSTTTVFAVVRSNFTISTETAYGTIRARRVR